MSDEKSPRSRLRLATRGEFAKLWASGTISSFGDWVSIFATLALGDQIGGGLGTLVPLVGRFAPAILFGALGGLLADRVNRKLVMMLSDIGRAFLVLSLIAVDSLPQLFAVSFALEMLSLIRQPVREAVVPDLVEPEELVSANSLSVIGTYGVFPFGALAWTAFSKLPEWLDLQETTPFMFGFLLDFATFMISAAILAVTAIPSSSLHEAPERWDWKEPFKDLAEGVRFVVAHRGVRVVIVGLAVALFGSGALVTLGQNFSRSFLVGDTSGFAILATAMGAGGGLGVLTVNRIDQLALHRMVIFASGILATGLCLTGLAFSSSVTAAIVWAFGFGAAAGVAYVIGITYLHAGVDEEVRGRTFAALFLVARTALLASMTASAFAAALLDGRFAAPLDDGVRLLFAGGGAITASAGLATLWVVREVWIQQPDGPSA